ncbi:MAG: hypothetical protein NVSMB39_7660 [Candidatus Saccharimonadales bacterium]
MDAITRPLQDALVTIGHWLPSLIGALLILLIGYLVAKGIESLVRRLLRRLGFDKLIHRGTAGSYISRVIESPAGLLGSLVFWVIWLGTLSIAVTVLGVPALTAFVYAIYAYLPNVFAALLIFLAAGVVSSAAAGLANRLMGGTATGKLVSTVVPALTMLIAVFMILNQLQIAKDIVNITYTALMGSVALGLALAFGLGGRNVAAKLLDQAYESGVSSAAQAKQDVSGAKERAKEDVERLKDKA